MSSSVDNLLKFRPARLDEAEQLNELINASFGATDPRDVYLPGKSSSDVDTKFMDVSRVVASIEDPSSYVVVVTTSTPSSPTTTTTTPNTTFENENENKNEEVIIAHAILHNLPPNHPNSQTTLPLAWLSVLAVSPAHQGRGIGAAVLRWAEEHARNAWGKARLELNVLSSRAPLLAWYRSRGYAPTGESSPFVYQYYGDWRGVLRDDLSFLNLGKDL
ncbi:acyl-CoA N-acyltransferase [Xylariaceae sp. FL0594]|nr:acyl-CoA N-acyltransferase [Xylariaceae sp. FL0594]